MNAQDLHEVILLDENVSFSLRDISRLCGLNAEHVLDMVNEGLIEPQGENYTVWRFSSRALWRARVATHLREDLGLNLAGAAMVLDLLEETRSLRCRLNLLEKMLLDET